MQGGRGRFRSNLDGDKFTQIAENFKSLAMRICSKRLCEQFVQEPGRLIFPESLFIAG